MLALTQNRPSKSYCTIHCTIVSHSSPSTVILPTHQSSILMKTFGPQKEEWSVAPNVAGSSPVSHPNFNLTQKLIQSGGFAFAPCSVYHVA